MHLTISCLLQFGHMNLAVPLLFVTFVLHELQTISSMVSEI